jgi:hypothetical protein
MLALILWIAFGWRWGVAEVATELACFVILGNGGGGSRALAGFRRIRARRPRRRLVAPSPA